MSLTLQNYNGTAQIELIITCAVSILVDMLSQMYEPTPAGVTTSNAH